MEKRDARFWLSELEMAARHEKDWRQRAKQVIRTYRDESNTGDIRFNILWSNTQTQRPALYSSTPKPVVARRHRSEGGAVERTMATALERSLTYLLDPGGSYDFDRVGEKLILDYLLPGRMVCRIKYHPILNPNTRIVESDEAPEGFEFDISEEGKYLFEEKYDELVDEEVRVYHVPWNQYRQAVANSFEDVWWVAFGNNFLTKEEIIDQFGDEHADVPLQHIAHTEAVSDEREGEERNIKRAQVWEIWDKDQRKVYAVVEGYDKLLMDIDDPLRLRGFYPMPEPVMIVETPDNLIPIPEYTLYQFQAQELNLITQRIEGLVKAMKVAGLYPGSQRDIIKELLSGKENTLIPVEDWGAITERGGLQGMIEWLPLRDIADAWQRLMVYRETLVQSIYDLTGISDIQRGSTDPRETKGAQQIKASFASRRLLPKQQDTQRFFRDIFRIQAEIIAEHFDIETIAKMSQMQVTPEFEQARQMMRDDALRSFVIDIETDSTIAPDDAMEKQGVAEFVAAMSQYLNQVFPIVQAQPQAMAPLGKMLLWISRKFRIARDAEDELEQFMQAFEQMPQQQDQEAQAKAQELQATMQMKMQEQQAALQIKQAESQADIQRKNLETQAMLQREKAKSDLENKKLLLEIEEKKAKIRLMQEEAEAKTVLAAVDQQAKRMQAESQKATEPKKEAANGVSIEMKEEKKQKRIKLIKDKDGKIEGAEITPFDKQTVKFNRDGRDKIASAEVE